MFKVTITHTATGNSWSGTFETEALAQAWLNEQTVKPWRNINPMWYNEADLTPAEIDTATNTRYIETGNGVYIKQYLLPAQATYEIVDITSELAKKAARDEQLNKGNVLRDLSKNILAIFSGYALQESFTETKINTFRAQYATIIEYLKAGMPIPAKTLMDAVTVDGTVIKQTLVDSINLEYTEFYTLYPDIFT